MSTQNETLNYANTQQDKPDTGLKHGQFCVYHHHNKEKNKVVVNPLTQDEIADGWRLVLPKARKNSTRHHHCIYLSQLPPHLWKRVRADLTNQGSYQDIKDNIYTYTVKMSKHDNDVRTLHDLMQSACPNMEEIENKYRGLRHARVKGWVMTRADCMLNHDKALNNKKNKH